jgi:hypothetical protein
MKGINAIIINYETLLEALQEYLDKRLVEKPVVLKVSASAYMNDVNKPELHVVLQENGDFLKGKGS